MCEKIEITFIAVKPWLHGTLLGLCTEAEPSRNGIKLCRQHIFEQVFLFFNQTIFILLIYLGAQS